jgi:uncharacterized phage protein gp47/JayE
MPYIPKSSSQILRDLQGGVLGRTELDDINAGSVLNTILASVAAEIASAERRLYTIRESFFLQGSTGSDLDDRVAELPPSGITRLGASNASGSVLKVTRSDDTTTELLLPKGSSFSSIDGQIYETTVDVNFPVNTETRDNIEVIAVSPGAAGNQETEQINTIVSAPAGFSSCNNTAKITNGRDEETDESLRQRAYIYLRSLSRCQKSAIEFMARSYVGVQGNRFTYAKVFEDVANAGFCELLVSDGSSTEKVPSRAGKTVSNRVPSGGTHTLYHEAPAVTAIDWPNIKVNGQAITSAAVQQQNTITSIHERGILYIDGPLLQPNDVVEIFGYEVYEGLLAEIQQEIEGDSSDYSRLTGFRAAGTRIVVKPPEITTISLRIELIPTVYANFEDTELRVRSAIISHVNQLSPGEQLVITDLIAIAKGLSGVFDIRFFAGNNENTAQDNMSPDTGKHVLRVTTDNITISTSNQENQ